LVLCEGETEEAYINFLKQRYRLPIKIVPKIVGSSLYPKKIEQYKKDLTSTPSEIKTFFLCIFHKHFLFERSIGKYHSQVTGIYKKKHYNAEHSSTFLSCGN
ncbi:MAG: hypothetical protein MJ159_03025, partial [Treponemataceae bacterium]|nr:hypothetical protein [Treponemataceae bacterium]